MADAVSTATLRVNVTGQSDLKALGDVLRQMQQSSRRTRPQPVTPAGRRNLANQAVTQSGGIGTRLGDAFGRALTATIRAPFDVLSAVAKLAVNSLLRLTGVFGR